MRLSNSIGFGEVRGATQSVREVSAKTDVDASSGNHNRTERPLRVGLCLS